MFGRKQKKKPPTDYSLTKQRAFQWLIIIVVLAVLVGTYFYIRSRAATTVSANDAAFEAPLTTSIELARGVGAPTFTRADGADRRASVTDFEGKIIKVKAGEARFEGARRVENINTATEALDTWPATATISPGVSDPNGGTTAVTATATGATQYILKDSVKAVVGNQYLGSVYVKRRTGSGTINLYNANGTTTAIPVTSSWQRLSGPIVTATQINSYIGIQIVTSGDAVDIWHPMLEDVTGQSNQNPSEYVSVGVKAAPYHGASVDGVKYFNTLNGNTVASNVVTEATGVAITSSVAGVSSTTTDTTGPHGYVAEGSRTNLALQSEDFSTTWATGVSTIVTNQAVAPDGTTTADLLYPTSSGNYRSVYQPITEAVATYTHAVYAKSAGLNWVVIRNFAGSGAGGAAWFDLANGVKGTNTISGFTSDMTSAGNGWYKVSVTGTSLVSSYFQIETADGDANINSTTSGTDGVYLWGAQSEAAAFASSYIPTTTASVTRAGDSLTYPTASNVLTTVGTVYLETYISRTADAWRGVTNNYYSHTADSRTFRLQSDEVTGILDRTSATDSAKHAFKYGTFGKVISVNGSSTSTVTTGTFFTGGSIYIGSNAGYPQMHGNIKNVKIWQKAFTDTQLQNLTSGSAGAVSESTIKVNRADFEADLLSTLEVQRGQGSATFTRADGADRRASTTDFEGKIQKVKAGEARFEGARRVENIIAFSEAFDNAAWTKISATVTPNAAAAPDGTTTAELLVPSVTLSYNLVQGGATVLAGDTYVISVYAMSPDANTNLQLSLGRVSNNPAVGSGNLPLTTSWKRYSLSWTVGSSDSGFGLYSNLGGTSGKNIYVWGLQVENAISQANQNPSEYISTNVKTASPYHGANVDGVKYFTTENVNTVASNVVSEPAQPGATLEGYVFGSLPGTSGAYFSTPDSAATSITGDIDIRVKVAPNSWANGTQTLAAKHWAQFSFLLQLNSASNLFVSTSSSGSGWTLANKTSTDTLASIGATAGVPLWVRYTHDVDNGAGGNDIKFWYSTDDAATWNQLGSTVTTAGTTSYFDSTDPVEFGSDQKGAVSLLNGGKIYRAQILNGINGTIAADFDPSQWSTGTTWTSRTNEVWTVNGAASIWKNTLKGYLAEGSRVNLALQSEDFATTWTIQSSLTVTTNQAIAPDGTTTADKVATNTGGASNIALFQNVTLSTATNYTLSGYAKAGTQGTYALIRLYDTTANVGRNVVFNLTTGVVTGNWANGAGLTLASSSITAVPNGWYRISATITSGANTGHNIIFAVPNNTTDYTMTSGDNYYLWGAQFEDGAFASTYIPTTTASVTRAADALSYPFAGNALQAVGTRYAEISVPWTTAPGNNVAIGFGPYAGGLLSFSGDASTTIRTRDGSGNTAVKTGLSDMNTGIRRRASVWSGNLQSAGGDGSTFASGQYDGNFGTTSISIGTDTGGTLPYFGTFRNVKIWQKALDTATLAALTAGTAGTIKQTTANVNQNDKQTSGLVGFWSFNGKDKSGNTVYDRSGQGNNGAVSGATTRGGKVGQALSFDGTDDQVNLGNPSALNFGTGDFTMSAWVKPSSTPTNPILEKREADNRIIQFHFSAGKIYFLYNYSNNYSYIIGNTALAAGNWYHIACVVSRSVGYPTCYLNGTDDGYSTRALVGSPSGTSMNNTGSALIGRSDYTTYEGNFAGLIDELRVYNTALSAADVANLYNLGR